MNRVPAVFFDRDGVLIASYGHGTTTRPPWTIEEVKVLPGAVEAVARVRAAGYRAVIITNQADVARGNLPERRALGIAAWVQRLIAVDGYYACYHDDADRCDCRKPKPGLITQAVAALGIDVGASALVGDRWTDVGAGRAAGVGRTVLIGDYDPARWADSLLKPTLYAKAITDAVDWILT